MKKALILLLTLVLLTGCSSNAAGTAKNADSSEAQVTAEVSSETSTQEKETSEVEEVSTEESSADESSIEEESSEVEAAEPTVDELFLADFVKALIARWDYSDTVEFKGGTQEHQDAYLNMVHIEQEILAPYKDAEFTDVNLSDLCQRYLACLEDQESCLGMMLSDYNAYYIAWLDYQGNRAVIFRELVDNYGITLDSQYADGYYTMYNKGFTHAHHAEVFSMLNTEFYNNNYTSGEYSFSTPSTNTTDNTFINFRVYVYLYDLNGYYMDYSSCFIEKWEPGETIDLTFDLSVPFSSVGSLNISED